jgi:hypothetical protein
MGALSVLSLRGDKLATKAAGQALAEMLAANTVLKKLDLSSNHDGYNSHAVEFAQELAVGIRDNEALSKFVFGGDTYRNASTGWKDVTPEPATLVHGGERRQHDFGTVGVCMIKQSRQIGIALHAGQTAVVVQVSQLPFTQSFCESLQRLFTIYTYMLIVTSDSLQRRRMSPPPLARSIAELPTCVQNTIALLANPSLPVEMQNELDECVREAGVLYKRLRVRLAGTDYMPYDGYENTCGTYWMEEDQWGNRTWNTVTNLFVSSALKRDGFSVHLFEDEAEICPAFSIDGRVNDVGTCCDCEQELTEVLHEWIEEPRDHFGCDSDPDRSRPWWWCECAAVKK